MIKKIILIYFLLFSFIFSQNKNNELDIAINTLNKITLEDKDFESAFDDLIYNSLNQFIQKSYDFSWSKSFNLTRPEDVKDILEIQKEYENLEDACEEECGIEFGKLVQAEYVINRTVVDFGSGLGSGYRVFLDFKSIETGLTLPGGSESKVIRKTGKDDIEIYENIEKEILAMFINMFNRAFDEPDIPVRTRNINSSRLDSPTIYPINVETKHSKPITISLTADGIKNSSEISAIYKFSLIRKPIFGTYTLNGNLLTYTPEDKWTGDEVITYTAIANRNGTPSLNARAEKITISVVNEAPIAQNSSITVQEDGRKQFNLSARDADADVLSYNIFSEPSKGTYTIDKFSGRVVYTPYKGMEGADSFTFYANDGLVNSNKATIDIDIDPLRTPPTADSFSASTLHGKQLTFFLRGYDADGDDITYEISKEPSNGEISIKNNKVIYLPEKDFIGEDEIYYFVKDEKGDTSTNAKITINVTNNRPNGYDESFNMKKGQSLRIELKGDDKDKSDIVKLSYIVERNPSFGTFKRERNSRNIYTYTPYSDFEGPDQIAYVIYDGAQYSKVNVITINVIDDNIVKVPSPQPPKDEGGLNITMILGVLLLIVLLGAAGGGGGGGGSDPTGGVTIGVTIP